MSARVSSSAVCSLLLLMLPACATPGADRPGMAEFEELVMSVERVHAEVELARESMAAAVHGLGELVRGGVEGEGVSAFRALRRDADASRSSASRLRESVASMRQAAEPVFEHWHLRLEEIGSERVRARTAARMDAMRANYEAIDSHIVVALSNHDALHLALADLRARLERDHGAAGLGAARDDLAQLERTAQTLDTSLQRCLAAAQDYFAGLSPTASLRGSMSVASPPR